MRSSAGSGRIPSGVLSMKDFNYVARVNDPGKCGARDTFEQIV